MRPIQHRLCAAGRIRVYGERIDPKGYYRDTHVPMVAQRMGAHCLSYSIDRGLAGGAPGSPPTYIAMVHLFCASVESFQAGFGPHAEEILADVTNYTDVTPLLQISEVVVG